GGKDPDELVRKDPKLWQQAIDNHVYAVDWLIARYQKQLDITSGQGKRQFTDIVLRVIDGLRDSVEQDHYVMELARLIGVSSEAIRTKLGQSSAQPARLKKSKSGTVADATISIEQRKTEQHFLALMLM